MRKKITILLSSIVIAGCASHQTPPDLPVNAPEKSLSNTSLTSWEIKGLMGLRTTHKSSSANVVWNQQGPDNYRLRLYGPMGGGTVRIERNHGLVSYQDDKKKIYAKEARLLVKQQTGFDLPVESLYYWVRALPAPGATSEVNKDAQGLPTQIKQAGFRIQYLEYIHAQNRHLPKKILLSHQALNIKLIIKSWGG